MYFYQLQWITYFPYQFTKTLVVFVLLLVVFQLQLNANVSEVLYFNNLGGKNLEYEVVPLQFLDTLLKL